jgi:hypothetical protein
MFSSILRIIQMSPNSNNAEKAMESDNHRYRDRTRARSTVPSGPTAARDAERVRTRLLAQLPAGRTLGMPDRPQ